MIQPDRHTNPEYSLLNLTAYIIKQLNTHYSISYDSLLKRVVDNIGEQSKENYPYALNFLFLVGKLEYQDKSDSFILIK